MPESSSTVSFLLDGSVRSLDFSKDGLLPSTTVLDYLKRLQNHHGTREACREGDCGACTVVIAEEAPDGRLAYKAVNACLLFLPAIHGKQLITVENLPLRDGEKLILHPVQQALLLHNGIQCGFCTPGVVMSMFALYKSNAPAEESLVREALAGNLCRCTGYHAILQACIEAISQRTEDHFDITEAETLKILREIRNTQLEDSFRTREQHYMIPRKLNQALLMLQQYPAATLVNGASDVAVLQNIKHRIFPEILDLSHVHELDFFYEDHANWFIGAGLRLQDLKTIAAGRMPVLHGLLLHFASLQIRNVATLAGNVASASPIGDALPLLFVMDARVHLASVSGSRIVPIEAFILSYRKTDLGPGELITMISIPKPARPSLLRWYKVSNRKDADIASVSAAFSVELKDGVTSDIRIAYGGMAATPLRAAQTEAFLKGKPWERPVVEDAMQLLQNEFTPIGDARSSALARTLAARNLLLKYWSETNADVHE
ncbi:MAG TPA: xanthine dehydrogenase small subunit [Bacteroidales bacterium]|nr:xanthine dehydrogenase small subunit [Bacteroidales bacterium]HSA44342.1 xanthine dehydrogenase small subunit [Bacteroidales bacterium]